MAPAMRRAGCGADSASGALKALATSSASSSGSSSSRISAHTRIKSARAAWLLRSQNASVVPTVGASAIAMPRRAGSRPMMWRTSTSAPNWPGCFMRLSFKPPSGLLRPTSVARTFSSASRGCSSVTFRSASITSSALSPSSSVTTLPSQAVITRALDTGWQPCVTRDINAAPWPKATPLNPPLNTPLAAPWPLTLPLPLSANCTVLLRLDASPPNT